MAENKKLLSVEDVLNAPDLEEKEVYVKEWGGCVKIKAFSKAKQQQLRKQATQGGEIDPDRFEMLLFIYGVAEPKFTEKQYEQLREKSAEAIDSIIKEVMEISGWREQAVKEAEKLFRIKQRGKI